MPCLWERALQAEGAASAKALGHGWPGVSKEQQGGWWDAREGGG